VEKSDDIKGDEKVMKIYETLESGIKIVDYDHSHAPSLAEFWNICGQEEDGDWGGMSGIMTAAQVITEHDMSSYYNVYLALDGDTVVGYCSFGRYFADANTLYVALLGVRPDYRSKKIGKALVLRCVQRTIELGYPRVDLFTWGGNTAAVPLYKKCGFLWEDRADGVHFVNFMPTILKLPIFADFFKKADWYNDSTRSLEIVPDGAKTNGFELFGYTWEKDGETLAVGYERAGRQMRMIETPDYKIELMAQGHELAFGTDYNCTFAIENKTGKELNIKITGREDKNIKLECNTELQVAKGTQEFATKFYVGAISEPQDPWKTHPCLLADVEINGQAVTFGLGIQAKFPLLVKFDRECKIDQVGMDVKTHISIQSALLEDATVEVKIPANKLLAIKEKSFTVSIPAKGKASIPTTSTTLAIGAEKLDLSCIATLKSGSKLDISVPAFVSTRDMAAAFFQEDFESYRIFNGPWELEFNKKESETSISHLTNSGYNNEDAFDAPKLGKPYDDEFNLIQPSVKTYQQGNAITMELEFVSEKFSGMVVTQVYTLIASGLITFTSKVENRSDKPRHVMLQNCYGLSLGFNSVFSYNGQITKNQDRTNPGGVSSGFANASTENIDENWIFEDSPNAPLGYCWPAEYKPLVEWGCVVTFEIDPGELAPGQVFESKPVIYALGLFTNYNDLRNYARQIYNLTPPPMVNAMEVVINEYNLFATKPEVKLDVVNNRDEVQEGTITVSSGSLVASISQTNPHEDVVECNSFDLSLNGAGDIAIVNVTMDMVGYERTCDKVVFFPKGEVTTALDGTSYNVSNGAITFKLDPKYSFGCYSLTDSKGQEWLFNQYPEHKPFSWFNPFLGGMRTRIDSMMDDRTVLKENITTEFTEVYDNFGNKWQGACTILSINEDEGLKGAVCKFYYLTQPGLPVLCSFYQFENGTGEYKSDRLWISSCYKPDDDAKNAFVEVTCEDGSKRRCRLGSVDCDEVYYKDLAVYSGSRAEKLYSYSSTKDAGFLNDFWANNKIPVVNLTSHSHVYTANGETFTSTPTFIVITDKELPQGAFCDLERVKFN